MSVIVTDARLKQSLAIARSLGRQGVQVSAAGIGARCQTVHSRYCHRHVPCANPNQESRRYVEDLREGAMATGAEILLPCSDAAVVPIARHRSLLEPVVAVPLPSTAAVLTAHEKWDLLRAAEAAGLPTPRTVRPEDPEEAVAESRKFGERVVVKPGQSSGSDGITIAATPEEVRAGFRVARAGSTEVFDRSRPLLQEYVPGEVHDACLLYGAGEVLAAMTQRRVWTYPIDGGSGALVRTTAEPELIDLSRRLLDHIGWTDGVVEVEFRVDPDSGEPILIEINPRFWGILDIAIAAGIDFPALLCESVQTGSVDPRFDYEVGLEFVWFDAELPAYLTHTENPAATIGKLARGLARYETNVSVTDPLPNILRWTELASNGLSRFVLRAGNRVSG